MNIFHCGRIIEICGLNRFLKKERGSLGVYEKDKKIGSVAFDDIQAVIFNAYDLCYTHNIIIEFAERNIPVIFCDQKHNPTSIILPFNGYFHQSRRMMIQAQAKKPFNKRLWKEIIKSKITQQARVLQLLNKKYKYLMELVKEVKSDDISNCEGQAARYYFDEIFGKDFIRDRSQTGINTFLNYGYTIFRSAIARAIVSYGLNPSIGIKHCNPNNTMPLVDDLLEPFRPIVDIEVYEMYFKDGLFQLEGEEKIRLARLLDKSIKIENITTTPNQVIHKVASSLGMVYERKEKTLYLPLMDFIIPNKRIQNKVN